MLSQLLPSDISLKETCNSQRVSINTLSEDERRQSHTWHPSRQRTFAAGRYCARQALARLDSSLDNAALARRDDGSVTWPNGYCGSITHTAHYAAAATTSTQTYRSIGIDAEAIRDTSGVLRQRICSAHELETIFEQPKHMHDAWLCTFFSLKEAIYKCQYPLTQHYLGFKDVEIILHPLPSTQSLTGTATCSLQGAHISSRTRSQIEKISRCIDLQALAINYAIDWHSKRVFSAVYLSSNVAS